MDESCNYLAAYHTALLSPRENAWVCRVANLQCVPVDNTPWCLESVFMNSKLQGCSFTTPWSAWKDPFLSLLPTSAEYLLRSKTSSQLAPRQLDEIAPHPHSVLRLGSFAKAGGGLSLLLPTASPIIFLNPLKCMMQIQGFEKPDDVKIPRTKKDPWGVPSSVALAL